MFEFTVFIRSKIVHLLLLKISINHMSTLKQILNIRYPIIMAPMFLVSNTDMVIEAMKSGISGCIPALNYRTIQELQEALITLRKHKVEGGAFGFNLIVNKSNIKYKKQLEMICREGCDFIITSLGNPKETIELAHKNGIKVFCDVTNLEFAKKVENLNADALIAVNNQAGGHRGDYDPQTLISLLKKECRTPIISAGGVSNKLELTTILSYGAAGASIGSPFIASTEAQVSEAYKQACVDYGKNDIVITDKISGTPCTVINTPYVQKTGTQLSGLEKWLVQNNLFKKWIKLWRFFQGSKSVTQAAKHVTYKTVWVAGPSIENTKAIEPVAKIIKRFI